MYIKVKCYICNPRRLLLADPPYSIMTTTDFKGRFPTDNFFCADRIFLLLWFQTVPLKQRILLRPYKILVWRFRVTFEKETRTNIENVILKKENNYIYYFKWE